ncbi:MAG: tetratricopeptide repeat protein [bacterium]
MAANKDVRHQLLEEIHTDDAQLALAWLQSRWKLWAGLVAGVLVAIAGYSGWAAHVDSAEKAAQAKLTSCIKALDGGSDQAETGITACDAVIAGHSGSAAAGQARLVKGVLLTRAGKAGDAVTELDSLLRDTPPKDPLHGAIQLALARSQEAAGKASEAVASYRALQSEGFTLDDHTTLDLVRALEASGKTDDAKKLLEDEIAKAGPGGPGGGSNVALFRARLALLASAATTPKAASAVN